MPLASTSRRAILAASATFLLATAPAHAAVWLAPHDIAVGSFSKVAGTAIAPDGTVTTALIDGTASQRSLKVAVKPPGQPFRAPVVLSAPTGTPTFAFTAGDRAGNVVLAWEEELNGVFVVRAATKPAGGEFTAAKSISDTGSSARWPRVAIAGGKAVVAWAQGGRVRAATGVAGGTLSVADPLTPFIDFDEPPAVATAADGSAVVAWRTSSAVHAAARPAGGEFAALPDVVTGSALPIGDLQAAMSASGRATLAWAAGLGVQSASRGKTGKFGGVETIAGASGAFALAMADDDTALLAWEDGKLRYALRPSGGGFGAAQTVPGSTTGFAPPRAVFAPDGSARVLWTGFTSSRASVETARIAPSGAADPAQTISPPSEAPAGQNDSIHPVLGLGIDDHGDAVATWMHSFDAAPGPAFDTRTRVRTALLDVTPPVISALRVPSSAGVGQGVAMSVTTADALSGATATWDFGDGTTEEGESLIKAFGVAADFTVRLTVTDDAGNVATAQRPIAIRAQHPPL